MESMRKRRVSVIFLYDKDKRILMQHRDDDCDILPGYWGMFGGGIEEGETPEQALRRELAEEIEYRLDRPEFIFQKTYVQDGIEFELHSFAERYDPSQPIIQHEGQGHGWFTIDEAMRLKITKSREDDLEMVRKYLDRIR